MDTDFLGGFEAVAGSLSNRTVTSMSSKGEQDPEDTQYEEVDPSELDSQDDGGSQNDDSAIEENEDGAADTDNNNAELDDSEEEGGTNIDPEEEVDDSEKGKDTSAEDLAEVEPEISQFVQEKLGEALGWEFGEDEKFNSIEDAVKFMKEVVDANSQPEFANEDLEKLNDYIKNGGDMYDYLAQTKGEVDIDSIDISDESNQKAVIRELLKEEGYSDERIKKRIERYEDAGVLEDEATDAKELLSEVREKKAKKLLKEKETQKQAIAEEQQKYVKGVEQTVDSLDSVRGIPISGKEKKQLMDYIFKPTADGRTQYQIDYLSDSKNLIESAYFTMKGDAFVKKVQKKANSDAAKNLKKKLSNKSKRQNNKSGDNSFIWGSISGQLRKPN
jgi:hypothetical protein